jgi:hypothetical protein
LALLLGKLCNRIQTKVSYRQTPSWFDSPPTKSQALRKEYIRKEHIRIVTHKPGGKLMREETADYEIVPSGTGSQTQLNCLKAATGTTENMKISTANRFPTPTVGMPTISAMFAGA